MYPTLRLNLRRLLHRNGASIASGLASKAIFVTVSVKPAELRALLKAASLTLEKLKKESGW